MWTFGGRCERSCWVGSNKDHHHGLNSRLRCPQLLALTKWMTSWTGLKCASLLAATLILTREPSQAYVQTAKFLLFKHEMNHVGIQKSNFKTNRRSWLLLWTVLITCYHSPVGTCNHNHLCHHCQAGMMEVDCKHCSTLAFVEQGRIHSTSVGTLRGCFVYLIVM